MNVNCEFVKLLFINISKKLKHHEDGLLWSREETAKRKMNWSICENMLVYNMQEFLNSVSYKKGRLSYISQQVWSLLDRLSWQHYY